MTDARVRLRELSKKFIIRGINQKRYTITKDSTTTEVLEFIATFIAELKKLTE